MYLAAADVKIAFHSSLFFGSSDFQFFHLYTTLLHSAGVVSSRTALEVAFNDAQVRC